MLVITASKDKFINTVYDSNLQKVSSIHLRSRSKRLTCIRRIVQRLAIRHFLQQQCPFDAGLTVQL